MKWHPLRLAIVQNDLKSRPAQKSTRTKNNRVYSVLLRDVLRETLAVEWYQMVIQNHDMGCHT
jgi:hypothetical protein